MTRVRKLILLFALTLAGAGSSAGCFQHQVQVEPVHVEPIHMTVDVNVNVDGAVDAVDAVVDSAADEPADAE